MMPVTYKESKSYKKEKVCYVCKKGFSTDDDDDDKKYHKVRNHCHYTEKYRGATIKIENAKRNFCNCLYWFYI